MEWKAELALDAQADLGEGPLWDERQERLIWVDIMAGRVNEFAPGRGAGRRWEVGEPVGAVALRETGGLVLAAQSGFRTLDEHSGRVEAPTAYDGASPEIRMNDGKCDPAGRFWAGTMALDQRPGAGALYRLDQTGRVEKLVEGVSISNGIDWTADERGMYYVDSPTRRIDWFDFDAETGRIEGRRTFVEIEEGAGFPDGLTVDAEGNVWVALWGGSAVRCYSAKGTLEGVARVGASQASSCTFGGEGFRDLYVTSARTGLSTETLAAEPAAGGLFVVRPGVAGRACRRYRG